MPDVTPPRHHVPVDADPITAAVAALARHDDQCPECATLLPESECADRVQLKAGWRRAVREGGLRCASADRGSAGGQMAAEEPAR